MTSFSDVLSAVTPAILNERDEAFQIALSELGQRAEAETVRELLRVFIDEAIERGITESAALAQAAVDEVVLVTRGKVRPS